MVRTVGLVVDRPENLIIDMRDSGLVVQRRCCAGYCIVC